MSKKIYVRQIEPENQESPVMQEGDNWKGTWLEGLVVAGNPCFREHTIPEYDLWEEKKYEIHAEMRERPESIFEILEECEIQTKEELISNADAWMKLAVDIRDNTRFYEHSENLTAKVLSILTGKLYACTMIHGCVQGDWNTLYFPANEWGRDAIREFEAEYFNTGSEWLVHEEEYEPSDPSEISGNTVYIADDWNDEMIRNSLSKVIGCEPSDLVVYKFEGYRKMPLFSCVK